MKKKGILIFLTSILICIISLVILYPIKVPCGSPNKVCSTTNDDNFDTWEYYYETEPLIVTLIESLLNTDLKIYYFSGYTIDTVSPNF